MSDEELLSIAEEFREGILDGDTSALMCAAVSWPLQGYLSALYHVEAECIETDVSLPDGGTINHVWLRLPDGRVLDPTADQFGFAAVYLGPPLAIHHRMF